MSSSKFLSHRLCTMTLRMAASEPPISRLKNSLEQISFYVLFSEMKQWTQFNPPPLERGKFWCPPFPQGICSLALHRERRRPKRVSMYSEIKESIISTERRVQQIGSSSQSSPAPMSWTDHPWLVVILPNYPGLILPRLQFSPHWSSYLNGPFCKFLDR